MATLWQSRAGRLSFEGCTLLPANAKTPSYQKWTRARAITMDRHGDWKDADGGIPVPIEEQDRRTPVDSNVIVGALAGCGTEKDGIGLIVDECVKRVIGVEAETILGC